MSLKNGLYKISFSVPARGRANGIVILVGGKLVGGDSVFSYTGNYTLTDNAFTARIEVKPHSDGRIGLRRMLDASEAMIEIVGVAGEEGAKGTGTCALLGDEELSVRLDHIARL